MSEDLGSLSEHEGDILEWSLPKEKKKNKSGSLFLFLRQNKLIFTSGGVLSDPGGGTKLTFCLFKPPGVSVLGIYTSHPSLLARVEVQGAPFVDIPLQRVPSFSAETSATLTERRAVGSYGRETNPPSINQSL